ncbi:MAG: HypC/HybG/HupF family hydrogenase formation chaperone [Acidilobaceae archaeon]
MCWGTPAIVIDVDEIRMNAKVDFGDGVVREAAIGISEERVSKGDIVIVHAGIIISKFTEEGVKEQIMFFKELLGDEAEEIIGIYENLLELARALKGVERGE